MRTDHGSSESRSNSRAECRRDRLLFWCLVLMSAMEIASLGLIVFVLIAAVSFIEGHRSFAMSSLIASAILVAAIGALEAIYRAARRHLAAMDKLTSESAAGA